MARTQRVPEWGEPTDVRGFDSDSSAVEPRSSRASSASSGLPCAPKVSRDQSRSAACSMSGAASQDSTTEEHQKHGLRDSVQATGALGTLLWVCGPRTAATRLAVYRPEVQPQQSGSKFSPRCPDRRDYTSRRECKFVGDV